MNIRNSQLNDTPPEEKELKDSLLKELSICTLKDIDFENLVIGELLKIDINENDAALILKTLQRDLNFLKKLGLMDFSLLLGVEKVQNESIEDEEVNVDDFNKTKNFTYSRQNTSNLNNLSVSMNPSILKSSSNRNNSSNIMSLKSSTKDGMIMRSTSFDVQKIK